MADNDNLDGQLSGHLGEYTYWILGRDGMNQQGTDIMIWT